MKSVEEIMARRSKLKTDLQLALSTMERKSTIYELRTELLNLQKECPHFSLEHSYAMIDGKCPYCDAQVILQE